MPLLGSKTPNQMPKTIPIPRSINPGSRPRNPGELHRPILQVELMTIAQETAAWMERTRISPADQSSPKRPGDLNLRATSRRCPHSCRIWGKCRLRAQAVSRIELCKRSNRTWGGGEHKLFEEDAKHGSS